MDIKIHIPVYTWTSLDNVWWGCLTWWSNELGDQWMIWPSGVNITSANHGLSLKTDLIYRLFDQLISIPAFEYFRQGWRLAFLCIHEPFWTAFDKAAWLGDRTNWRICPGTQFVQIFVSSNQSYRCESYYKCVSVHHDSSEYLFRLINLLNVNHVIIAIPQY